MNNPKFPQASEPSMNYNMSKLVYLYLRMSVRVSHLIIKCEIHAFI